MLPRPPPIALAIGELMKCVKMTFEEWVGTLPPTEVGLAFFFLLLAR
jgi:hypothetical protein